MASSKTLGRWNIKTVLSPTDGIYREYGRGVDAESLSNRVVTDNGWMGGGDDSATLKPSEIHVQMTRA
jgi:hypothetical protein